MHVFPATANDCILQTNSFGLVNRHIFRPTDKNGTACLEVEKLETSMDKIEALQLFPVEGWKS